MIETAAWISESCMPIPDWAKRREDKQLMKTLKNAESYPELRIRKDRNADTQPRN